jgi:hypothetical protein
MLYFFRSRESGFVEIPKSLAIILQQSGEITRKRDCRFFIASARLSGVRTCLLGITISVEV